jgi:hypothetical protein
MEANLNPPYENVLSSGGARPESHLISGSDLCSSVMFQPSHDRSNEYNASAASDLQPQTLPSERDQLVYRSPLYCYNFNDTSLAMQGLSNEPPDFSPQHANDTTIAMQVFASEAECNKPIGRTDTTDAFGIENEPQPFDPYLTNDTNVALFGITPQIDISSTSSVFNDTSIAMSAFASDAWYEH